VRTYAWIAQHETVTAALLRPLEGASGERLLARAAILSCVRRQPSTDHEEAAARAAMLDALSPIELYLQAIASIQGSLLATYDATFLARS